MIGLVGAAMVAGAAIATASFRKARTATEKAHPLKGALNKRMELFSQMAKHNHVERPPRMADDKYTEAPDGLGVAVV